MVFNSTPTIGLKVESRFSARVVLLGISNFVGRDYSSKSMFDMRIISATQA